jgi:hypothetical protein
MKTSLAETMRVQLDTWLGTQPDAEAICAMLQPHVPGPALALSVTRQPQWSLTLARTADTYPPLALGDWYRPLTAWWIPPEFDLAAYQRVLAGLEGSA